MANIIQQIVPKNRQELPNLQGGLCNNCSQTIRQIVNAAPGSQVVKTIIKQAERGPVGPPGVPGESATVAVGETATLPPGSQAEVTNVGTESQAIFNFKIPQGPVGPPGPQGEKGEKGDPGVGVVFTSAEWLEMWA